MTEQDLEDLKFLTGELREEARRIPLDAERRDADSLGRPASTRWLLEEHAPVIEQLAADISETLKDTGWEGPARVFWTLRYPEIEGGRWPSSREEFLRFARPGAGPGDLGPARFEGWRYDLFIAAEHILGVLCLREERSELMEDLCYEDGSGGIPENPEKLRKLAAMLAGPAEPATLLDAQGRPRKEEAPTPPPVPAASPALRPAAEARPRRSKIQASMSEMLMKRRRPLKGDAELLKALILSDPSTWKGKTKSDARVAYYKLSKYAEREGKRLITRAGLYGFEP